MQHGDRQGPPAEPPRTRATGADRAASAAAVTPNPTAATLTSGPVTGATRSTTRPAA